MFAGTRVGVFLFVLVGSVLGFSEKAVSGVAHSSSGRPPAVVLSVKENLITLTSYQAPLSQVLNLLARQFSFTVQLEPSVAGKSTTVAITNLSLQDAIERLLVGTDYLFVKDHLYVSSGGKSTKAPTFIDPSWQALRQNAIHASDPSQRLSALQELSELGREEEVVPALTTALRDEDPEVRDLALQLLEQTEGPLPINPIAAVVQGDPDPDHRIRAMVLLANREEQAAEQMLRSALNDQDDEVRELALELMVNLDIPLNLDESNP